MTRRDAAGQFRKARTLPEWVGAVLRRRARNRRMDARERVLLPGGGWVEANNSNDRPAASAVTVRPIVGGAR